MSNAARSFNNDKELEELEHILVTGQPMAAKELITLMRRYGYERKDGNGGSHIKLENKNGQVFVFPYGTTDLIYQRSAAKICIGILTAQKNDTPKLQENSSASPAKTNKINLREALRSVANVNVSPEHVPSAEDLGSIEIADVPGAPSVVALRFQYLPFVGIVAPAETALQEIQSRSKEFGKKVIDLITLLQEVTGKYGTIMYQTTRGKHILKQPDYDIEIEIPVYDGLNQKDAMTEILAFAEKIQRKDNQIQQHLKSLLEKAESDGKAKKQPGKNGMVDWTLEKTHEITGKKRDFKITISPEFRVLPSVHDLYIEEEFRFEIAGFDEPKYFSNIMREYYGAEVHRPREGKNPGSKLVITHPFFPEARFEMPVASEIPRIKTYHQKLRSVDSDDEVLEIGCTLENAWDDIIKCKKVYNDMRVILNHLWNLSVDRYNILYAGTMSVPGSSHEIKGAKKFGEHGTYIFTNPAFSEPVTVNVISVASENDRRQHCIIADPRNMDKWAEILSQARKKIAAGFKGHLPNPPHPAL